MAKGGYKPDGRLSSNGDEIIITLMEAVRADTPEARRRAFREAVQLARERLALLSLIDGNQPPLGLAGA